MKITEVVKKDLCVSCGLCALGGAQMPLKKGINVPVFEKQPSKELSDELYGLCPGKGYPIVQMGKTLFEDDNTTQDYRLGQYREIGAARSDDAEWLKESTSGAMMPLVAQYLLDTGRVDGVLTVKFDYSKEGPVPKPFIAKSKSELILSQGSKYRPIPLFENIDELLAFPGALAVIGTPCQIAGIRLFQQQREEVKEKIKYTIANFCGGYRDYRETERIFQIHKVEKSDIEKFSYRGNGQPGTMTINQKGKSALHLNYPDYARLTGYVKYYRCRTCVDATGELADISFGDAWRPRFLNTGKKWSFYIARSKEMQEIMYAIKDKGLADFENITVDELVKSQQGNLTTKKERQQSRYKLCRLMGASIPKFDGGYNKEKTSLLLEAKVFASHYFMYMLEKAKLYQIFAKFINRVKQ